MTKTITYGHHKLEFIVISCLSCPKTLWYLMNNDVKWRKASTNILEFYLLNGYHYQNTYRSMFYLFTRFTKIVRVRCLLKCWTWLLQNCIPAWIPLTTFLTIQCYLFPWGRWEPQEWGVMHYQLVPIGSLCVLGDRRISWYLSHCGGGVAVERGCSWNNHSPKKHSYTGALAVSPSPLHPPIT